MKMSIDDQIDIHMILDLHHGILAGARIDDNLHAVINEDRIAEGKSPIILALHYFNFPEINISYGAAHVNTIPVFYFVCLYFAYKVYFVKNFSWKSFPNFICDFYE
jgi:hypothetical protein